VKVSPEPVVVETLQNTLTNPWNVQEDIYQINRLINRLTVKPVSPSMASLLTTMYEFLNCSPPRPLSPHLTFKQSSSCVTVNSYTFLDRNNTRNADTTSSPASLPSSRAAQLLRLGLGSPVTNIDSYSSPSSNARTRGQFKPQRANKGTTSYQLRQFAEATLGSGSLRKAVKLPEGEDLNEWLAVNGKESGRKGDRKEE